MMWTIASYQPVALFSLKPATATSSGGKTLICPTPFALKMALVDCAIRLYGLDDIQSTWWIIRQLQIRIRLPSTLAVVNTFTKIVRPKKNGASDDDGTGLQTPLGRTIAYREYVSFGGPIDVAYQTHEGAALPNQIAACLEQITYFGKRGSFMQLLEPPAQAEESELTEQEGWTTITADQPQFLLGGTLQLLDDCPAQLPFERVDIYSTKGMSLGKERILRHIVLPYTLERSSRNFSLYTRITS